MPLLQNHGVQDHGVQNHGVQDHGVQDHGAQDHGAQDHGAQDHRVQDAGAGCTGPLPLKSETHSTSNQRHLVSLISVTCLRFHRRVSYFRDTQILKL